MSQHDARSKALLFSLEYEKPVIPSSFFGDPRRNFKLVNRRVFHFLVGFRAIP